MDVYFVMLKTLAGYAGFTVVKILIMNKTGV